MDLKRNLDEIIALYEIEETIRDIYVEGNSDKSFFQWIINSDEKTKTEIYCADDISIPDELLTKYALSSGSARNIIIAASMAVAEAIPEKSNAIFVVDRDYADYIAEFASSPLLRLTDYNSIELYALNENAIKKLMALAYGKFSLSPPSFYVDMNLILKSIFAIRLANIKLGWNMIWLDFKKYVKVGGKIEFLEREFIDAYLKKNSLWGKKEDYYSALDDVKRSLQDDLRLSSRGHDFTILLMHILNKKNPSRKIDKIDVFEGFVIGLLEKADLISEKLIGEIFEFSRPD